MLKTKECLIMGLIIMRLSDRIFGFDELALLEFAKQTLFRHD